MQKKQNIKTIITLGPSTSKVEDLFKIKNKGVDFVRVNLSHSSLEDLEYFLKIAKEVGVPFIIDTQGSQVRTGELEENKIFYIQHSSIKIYGDERIGNKEQISLTPGTIISQLKEGDLLYLDFDTLIIQIIDTAVISKGYICGKVIRDGFLGRNKAVIISPGFQKSFDLPTLTEKDKQAINLGLKYEVDHVAASFIRSGNAVDEVRKFSNNKMKVISKIECTDALRNIDDIIQKTDFLLLDRGDLSKEISLTRLPFTQKILIDKAKTYKKGFFIATNLLESMISNRKPTRAEVHDVVTTILDGAYGLVMAAETAIGKYPIECINMLYDLIDHVEQTIQIGDIQKAGFHFAPHLGIINYLNEIESSSLVKPHGGKLVNRMTTQMPGEFELLKMPKIKLEITKRIEIEQIAIGTYSPLEGFMNEEDLNSVLENMRLSNGTIWPIPIVLDVEKNEADNLMLNQRVLLTDADDNSFGILVLESKFTLNKNYYAEKLYGTLDPTHPGVKLVNSMNDILLSGKINLFSRLNTVTSSYEYTPGQVRKLFEEYGWTKIAGFHTRNIPHKGHEFIIYNALLNEYCDGVFIHPVVGKKKPGDFDPLYVIKSYEKMIELAKDSDKFILGAFSTFSRYAGPKEAVFTALCRKNYGCSHFIIGRDHTGVGNFYHPLASQEIFNQFPDIGISIIKSDEVVYSTKSSRHYFNKNFPKNELENMSKISGTQVRRNLHSSIVSPEWLIDPEISKMLISAITNNEKVFV